VNLQTLIEYMKLHLISLEQDQAEISNRMEALDPNSKDFNYLDIEFNWLNGQIAGISHILKVAEERE
jgi:hypothetical protein